MKSMTSPRSQVTAVLAVGVLLVPFVMSGAQSSGTSAPEGTVTDSSGAAIRT